MQDSSRKSPTQGANGPDPLYEVFDWQNRHESAQSKKVETLSWFPTHANTVLGMQAARLLRDDSGRSALGTYIVVVATLATRRHRGPYLTDSGTASGRRWTAEDVGALVMCPRPQAETELRLLVQAGYLVEVRDSAPSNKPTPPQVKPQWPVIIKDALAQRLRAITDAGIDPLTPATKDKNRTWADMAREYPFTEQGNGEFFAALAAVARPDNGNHF